MSVVAVKQQALLECRAIGKNFGGVAALEGVDFDLRPGEVHGVVGCNGAGKSTLMKILAGAHPDHDGSVLIDGREVSLSSPREAQACGIAMVYQELSGIGALSVAENLFLGRQPTRMGRIDWGTIHLQAQAYLSEMQIDVDVRRRLDRFPLVIRQMVEIARGLHSGARVLILDEPTSAQSARDAATVRVDSAAQTEWRGGHFHQPFSGRCAGDLRSSDGAKRWSQSLDLTRERADEAGGHLANAWP